MPESLAKLELGGCSANIYELEMPGQFSIQYCDASGKVLAEEQLSGVSSYRQREDEIMERLKTVCAGGKPAPDELDDSGEY